MFDWLGRSAAKAPKPQVVSVVDAHARAHAGDLTIVDVRMPEEWARTGMPEGARGLTLGTAEFSQSLSELRAAHPHKTLAMFCKTGMRAQKAAEIAQSLGIDQLAIVAGGMEAWAKAELASMPFEHSNR